MTQLAIGSTVYLFDENHRVYPKGGGTSGPIYREHFRPVKIVGETSRSWILNYYNAKLDKKYPRIAKGRNWTYRICVSQAEVDDDVWKQENAYRIGEEVRRCHDVAKLKRIAAMLGYQEQTK